MQGEVGYNSVKGTPTVDAAHTRQMVERANFDTPKRGSAEHLTVSAAINVLTNDMRQLQEQIGELRARLSPVLADHEHLNRPQQSAPVQSKMAADLYDVLTMAHQCRELVELTMMQLDL